MPPKKSGKPTKAQRDKSERAFIAAAKEGDLDEVDRLYRTEIGLLPNDDQMFVLENARDDAENSGNDEIYDFLAGLIDLLHQEM